MVTVQKGWTGENGARRTSLENYEVDSGSDRWLACCCSVDRSVGDCQESQDIFNGLSVLLCCDLELGCKKNHNRPAKNTRVTGLMQVYRYFGLEWRERAGAAKTLRRGGCV